MKTVQRPHGVYIYYRNPRPTHAMPRQNLVGNLRERYEWARVVYQNRGRTFLCSFKISKYFCLVKSRLNLGTFAFHVHSGFYIVKLLYRDQPWKDGKWSQAEGTHQIVVCNAGLNSKLNLCYRSSDYWAGIIAAAELHQMRQS